MSFRSCLKMRRLRVESFAGERADHRRRKSPIRGRELPDLRFNLLGDFRRRRRPIARRKFEALIFRRIMTGGHVDAADGFADANGVGDHRRRCGAIAQQRLQAVMRQHFGREPG